MAFDPTPGFNLGLTDIFRRGAAEGNRFEGSGGNSVYLSAPANNPVQQQDLSGAFARAAQANAGLSVNQQQGISLPNSDSGGYSSGYYTGGSGNSQSATDQANSAAFYQNQIGQLQAQMGQLDNQQGIGLENIANSYTQGQNRLNQQYGTAKGQYDLQGQNNQRSYVNNRNAIRTNTASQANALQRLLGINGAGNSSAAYEQAPYAASLYGSQQLNDAQGNYAGNQQNLDYNWMNTERQFKNNREDLDNQKYQQENSLRSTIAQTRANLLSKIAEAGTQRDLSRGTSYATAIANQAGAQGQVNSLLSEITNLGRQYANRVNPIGDVTYSAPELNQYLINRGGSQQAGAAAPSAGQSNVNPDFLTYLATPERDRYGNLV